MFHAFLFGLLATSSLILGGIIAIKYNLSSSLIGKIMGFGAGTLISAISYELVFEAVKLGRGSYYPTYGFFSGALLFYGADRLIGHFGAKNRLKLSEAKESNLIVPMVLAIILDGIPESIIIGLGFFKHQTGSLAMLVAVFISNLPEAIAGSSGMKKGNWSNLKIISLWIFITFLCALASMAGYSFFGDASSEWLSFIQAFAGGAILMMLANSMIPEAYEHGHKSAGVYTVVGFFVSVCVVVYENMG
ncbi:ZIP family metal transporter [Flavobacterium daemonense]|uniref:ZIP family metal transporter n=1 Tax=Flavobacterium daemonense TaxID=1393049 RepID=UPI0011852473|nr:ZIP family zinc transporter [Flavobacterium daemonense]KAF2336903.1 ZIP family zinc transporter [Flavobacterium daemonense]